MIRIAFGSKARVGKDTSADYIKERFGGNIVRFASPVYEIAGLIQQYLGKPNVKDPGLLQLIGNGLRNHYGNTIWTDRAEIQFDDNNIIIPDMRFVNEFEMLKRNKFITVKLTRSNRIIDRDPNDPSEIGLDNTQTDYEIANDYSPEFLKLQLNHIIMGEFPKAGPFPDYCEGYIEVKGKKIYLAEFGPDSYNKMLNVVKKDFGMSQHLYLV